MLLAQRNLLERRERAEWRQDTEWGSMTAPLILPASQTRAASNVRPLAPGDLSAVARLFQKRFGRRNASAAPASLTSYLGDLYFSHPWRDAEITSRVHVSAAGAVDGFIGVFPSRMTLGGRTIRAAIAGSLMVDEPAKNPLAGARLLRAFFAGPQDVAISETANALSQGMWMRLGGHVVPMASMEWLRVFCPASAALSLVGESVPVAKVLRPFTRLADFAVSRVGRNPFRLTTPSVQRDLREADADEEAFVAATLQWACSFHLRPDWNAHVVRWLLWHAQEKERHGAMVRRLVYGPQGKPIGGYIYYGRPGGVAWVLQILAESGRTEPILDSLLAHALNMGAVAVRGRTHPMLMESLLSRGCVFAHRSATMVHARDSAILEAARSNNALITGLAGENWSRLIGGVFR